MKNNCNLYDDGHRWSMLFSDSVESVFKRWGASEIYTIPNDKKGGRSGHYFMIRLEDGWHLASHDGTSAHSTNKAYEFSDPAMAWAYFELTVAQRHRQYAEENLKHALAAESKARAELETFTGCTKPGMETDPINNLPVS